MHTNFFKRNRKGQKWLTSETIIFFFGAILLIATVAFFFRLQSAVFAEGDDGSKANFFRLQDEIKEMMDNGVAEKTINYFISEDFVVAGFDTNWDSNKKGEQYAQNIIFGQIVSSASKPNLFRPFDCGNSACLCLYNTHLLPNKIEESNKGVVECRREGFVDKNIIFDGGVGKFNQPCNHDPNLGQGCYTSKNKLGVNELHIQIDETAGTYYITITN